MANVISLFANKSNNALTLNDMLPSPTNLESTMEQIWSENTGRAQSGSNKAKMIGDSVAEKNTYQITWDMLTQAQFNKIKQKLTPGFFYFGLGSYDKETDTATPPSDVGRYYRSEIKFDIINVINKKAQGGAETRYRNVQTSVIEQ